jgi:hypothetical protein
MVQERQVASRSLQKHLGSWELRPWLEPRDPSGMDKGRMERIPNRSTNIYHRWGPIHKYSLLSPLFPYASKWI